ncbi:MAG: serine/threonine-protein phosphatase [Bacilli bacterium]|nr:serine/threonine-protein phosphatase [Bacilli bacterium]MBO6286666.1 serine/threonine-protein phosphatase [Bacilli bacterium]
MAKPKNTEPSSQAYLDNEADANRRMSYVNAIAAGVALVLFALYLAQVFTVPDVFLKVIYILFPTAAVILLIPLLFLRSPLIRKPSYKYFLLFSFLLVVAAINAAIPKHGTLGWALGIAMASHYFSPRFARKVFIATLVAMLACIYLGMLFGEYDPLLLGLGVVVDGRPNTVNSFMERIEYLNHQMAQGNNRYLKAFTMYYLPRAAVISLLFITANALNRRTNKLLAEEVRIHDEREKDKAELNIAKDMQLSTLPTSMVNDGEVVIVGEVNAAKEVGGDLYDYLDIDENHVAILIGDVSGKGVPAAMFMMKTITSFRDFATAGKKPSQILSEINASIRQGNKASMFVTCFLAILDKRDGTLAFANAGHNPPIVGSGRNYRYLQCETGFLLGCFPETFSKDEETILQPGESITLYTDGVTEARNIQGDFFGETRLLSVYNRVAHESISDLHSDLKGQVSAFVGEAKQSDDITLLTLKYLGK